MSACLVGVADATDGSRCSHCSSREDIYACGSPRARVSSCSHACVRTCPAFGSAGERYETSSRVDKEETRSTHRHDPVPFRISNFSRSRIHARQRRSRLRSTTFAFPSFTRGRRSVQTRTVGMRELKSDVSLFAVNFFKRFLISPSNSRRSSMRFCRGSSRGDLNERISYGGCVCK